jgi:hypothetical protein
MVTTALYETDFYAWTMQQAELLKNEDFAEIDLNHLIEEIAGMGRSEQRELDNRFTILLRHLLKLSCLPNSPPSRGWRSTVKEQRYQIDDLLKKNPSLRPLVSDTIRDKYAQALDLAMDDLANDDLVGSALPVRCPWTVEQLLDLRWFP